MREIKFRACPGFAKHRYEVGSDGSVWSLNYNHTGKRKQLRQYLDEDGYPYVVFVIHGKRYKQVVHRQIAHAFIGPKPEGKQVNHINGVRTDNRADNLEYLTSRENTLHGWRVNGRKVSERQRVASSQAMIKANIVRWQKHNTELGMAA